MFMVGDVVVKWHIVAGPRIVGIGYWHGQPYRFARVDIVGSGPHSGDDVKWDLERTNQGELGEPLYMWSVATEIR